MGRFLRGRRGNMGFWALVIALVFLPMGTLVIDAPRLYVTSIRLQSAVDAAAEAAARCVDVAWYQDTGETRPDAACAEAEAQRYFTLTAPASSGVRSTFAGITVDESADSVSATGTAEVDVFFLHVPVHMNRTAVTSFRMAQE